MAFAERLQPNSRRSTSGGWRIKLPFLPWRFTKRYDIDRDAFSSGWWTWCVYLSFEWVGPAGERHGWDWRLIWGWAPWKVVNHPWGER